MLVAVAAIVGVWLFERERRRSGPKLERHVLGIYERAGRAITPSATAWHQSGDVLAAMRRDDGLELARLSKAFANDVLLALSCREAGCVLVTENTRDFSRIQRFITFDFVAPWP